ncbi:MAG: family 10 glycosylhydrolase [Lewinellaceae bacterium]|nr:family 10 glycosylhydrolase [Lewinellaceae bacterium]
MTPAYRLTTLAFLFFLFFQQTTLWAQPPMAEMRGAWIATVANIDLPSKPGLPIERQKVEFDSLLDVLRAMNMNAVFVQIRPAGDAFTNRLPFPGASF